MPTPPSFLPWPYDTSFLDELNQQIDDATPHLRHPLDPSRIGLMCEIDTNYTSESASASNHAIGGHLPHLFLTIPRIFRTVGISTIYASNLALPTICLTAPIDTKLPRTFFDLSNGDITFTPPAGRCLQWHMKNHVRDQIIFA